MKTTGVLAALGDREAKQMAEMSRAHAEFFAKAVNQLVETHQKELKRKERKRAQRVRRLKKRGFTEPAARAMVAMEDERDDG